MQTGQPLFYLQIVDAKDGATARIPGGGELEANLIDLCTKHIMSKGVGFFRTEKHVEADVRKGIADAIMSMKEQTKHIAGQHG